MKLVNKGINVCMRKYSNVHKFYHRVQLAPGHGQHGIDQKLKFFLMTFCMIMHQQIATKLQGSRFCLYYVLSITVSHSRLLLWLQGHHTTRTSYYELNQQSVALATIMSTSQKHNELKSSISARISQ